MKEIKRKTETREIDVRKVGVFRNYTALISLSFILWHVDPLIGKDRETTTRKRPLLGNGPYTGKQERCFFVLSVPKCYSSVQINWNKNLFR
jgi:hypothetical protein